MQKERGQICELPNVTGAGAGYQCAAHSTVVLVEHSAKTQRCFARTNDKLAWASGRQGNLVHVAEDRRCLPHDSRFCNADQYPQGSAMLCCKQAALWRPFTVALFASLCKVAEHARNSLVVAWIGR